MLALLLGLLGCGEITAQSRNQLLAVFRGSDMKVGHPGNGDAVSQLLAERIDRSLDGSARAKCRQMGRPAGPNRYFCTVESRGWILWASYRLDPRSDRISLYRRGVMGILQPS